MMAFISPSVLNPSHLSTTNIGDRPFSLLQCLSCPIRTGHRLHLGDPRPFLYLLPLWGFINGVSRPACWKFFACGQRRTTKVIFTTTKTELWSPPHHLHGRSLSFRWYTSSLQHPAEQGPRRSHGRNGSTSYRES